MGDILYTPITTGDVDVYRRARLRALREDGAAFTETFEDAASWPISRWVERVGDNAAHDQSSTHLAWHDEQVVGMATGVVRADPEAPELVAMWVAPEVRGRGVGAELVQRVRSWAEERGANALELWVITGNEAAITLYERCGFSRKDDHRAAPDDPCRNQVRMQLSLGAAPSRPTTDVTVVLLDSMDRMFEQLLVRLDGLTNDEYLWEPVGESWSVRPDPSGRPMVEGAGVREIDPAPFTTVAWRLWHLAMDCLDDYTRRFDGDQRATSPEWTLDAEDAIEILRQKWTGYRAAIAGRDGWDLLGDAWGPWSQHSIADMAMHASNELVHHGAEIAVLRDLYRHSRS